MPDLQIDGWICIMATGGTPAPIVARLDQEIAKASALPQVHDAFAKQGVEDFHMGPQDLGKFLDAEAARYSSLLKHSRVRPLRSKEPVTSITRVWRLRRDARTTAFLWAPLRARRCRRSDQRDALPSPVLDKFGDKRF